MRKSAITLTDNEGVTKTLTEWTNDKEVNILGLSYQTISARIRSKFHYHTFDEIFKTAARDHIHQKDKNLYSPSEMIPAGFKNVHPDILKEMRFGTNRSFLEACEKVERENGTN